MGGFFESVAGFLTHPLTLALGGFAAFCLLVLWALNNVRVGKPKPWRPTDRPWLNGVFYFAAAFSPVLLLLFFAVLAMIALVGWHIFASGMIANGTNNLRWYVLSFVALLTALGGIIGTPLALIRVWTTERQTSTQERGLVTDRINAAVESLGSVRNVHRQRRRETGKLAYENSDGGKPDFDKPIFETITEPNIEVRIGALYALERIARDNLSFHIQIIDILSAYVRQNSPATQKFAYPLEEGYPSPPEDSILAKWRESLPKLRQDIQITLTVIGRISPEQVKAQELGRDPEVNRYILDLRGCCLIGADLRNLHLRNVQFQGAELQGSDFEGTILTEADLSEANLQGAYMKKTQLNCAKFFGTKMQGANLSEANLTKAVLLQCGLQGAILWKADLNGAFLGGSLLQGASLRHAKLRGADLSHAVFDDATNLEIETLRGALISNVDISKISRTQLLAESFGDNSAILPNSMFAGKGDLAHWSPKNLDFIELMQAWRDHQRSIGEYSGSDGYHIWDYRS